MSKPKVSVWMITYNHQDYIAQAIDSILIQKTNFDIEIVIGDDYSTDDTRQIIKQYAEKHQEIIIPIFHKKNIGIQRNFATTIENCSGKYIALCEGDDYWTDPLKLQKQVDFLEANEDFSMACNSSSEVYEDGIEFKIAKSEESIIDLGMVLREGWFIRTASIVFRREAIKKGFPDFFFKAYSTDYILQAMILKQGKCKYFPEVMSAYRRNIGGISNANPELQIKRWIQVIDLLDKLDDFTNNKFTRDVKTHQDKVKRMISFHLIKRPKLISKFGFEHLKLRLGFSVVLSKVKQRLFR